MSEIAENFGFYFWWNEKTKLKRTTQTGFWKVKAIVPFEIDKEKTK